MDNEPIVISIEQPTVKEQFVQVGVGLGIAAVITVGTLLIFAAAGSVADKIQSRRAKKTLPEPSES